MGKIKKCAFVLRDCVACGCCAKACPQKAISIHKGVRAVVDENRCVGCGKCEKACPAAVISILSLGGDNNAKEALV